MIEREESHSWRRTLIEKLDRIETRIGELKIDVEVLKAKDSWSARWSGVMGGGVVSLIVAVIIFWVKSVS